MLSGAVDDRVFAKVLIYLVLRKILILFSQIAIGVNVLKMVFTKIVFVCLKNATPTIIYGCFDSV